MVITIDGPAGTGKSTISALLAQKLSAEYINSGAFYRAITYIALETHKANSNIEVDVLISEDTYQYYTEDIIPSINWKANSIYAYYNTDNTNSHEKQEHILKQELFTDFIDKHVAQVSKIVPLRLAINKRIQEISSQGTWIIEGRDAGKNIFPLAEYKFYLDASLEVRAQRRNEQYNNNQLSNVNIQQDEVSRIIQSRDEIDRNKGSHSLTIASDAHYLDTSHYTIDEILNKVYNIINK